MPEVPEPLAGSDSGSTRGSNTTQPAGIPTLPPRYRAYHWTPAWIGWPVQFCATRVTADVCPGATVAGLTVIEVICTAAVPVQVAADAFTVPTTNTPATAARTNDTAATAIRRICTHSSVDSGRCAPFTGTPGDVRVP